MKNAGILQGDLVVCEPRQFANDGEIVVALINGEETTVKRFFIYTTDDFSVNFLYFICTPCSAQDMIFMIYWIVRVRLNPSLFP